MWTSNTTTVCYEGEEGEGRLGSSIVVVVGEIYTFFNVVITKTITTINLMILPDAAEDLF